MAFKNTWNCKRQVFLQFRQLPLLFSLFTLRTLGQVPDSPLTASGRVAIPVSVGPSPAEIDRAIALSADYLERACGPDGRFVYRINVNSGEQSHSYNIVRHAGAMYALAMLQHSEPNQQAVDAMARAAFFMRQNYIGPGMRSNQLVVWSRPRPQNSTADLGATGLGLVALTSLELAKPNSVPLLQLQALGHFLVFLQNNDGSFVNKYRAGSGPDEDFESLYYPGEAALGLIDLYQVDHSSEWLAAAAKALSYLARSRAKLSDVPPDHWALIATAKLLPNYAQSASPASRQELIQHAIQVCQALMKDQFRNPGNQGLDGAFDPTGRTAPTATRMEGLLAALEFIPDRSMRTQIQESVEHGVSLLIRSQIKDGLYAGGLPGASTSSAAGASDIRIDFVQHALCAWLRYKQLFQTAGAAPPPLSGRDAGHIRVLFGGDTDFGESYQEEYARNGKTNILEEKGYDYSLVNLRGLLQGVDYRIFNLETPLTLHHDSSLKGKDYLHYSDPVKAPAALGRFGPIAYSLANNHTLDQGVAGLDDTASSLDAAGARYFGAGKDVAEAENPLIQTFQAGDASFTLAVFGGLEYSRKYEEQFHFYATTNHPGVAPVDAPAVEKAIRDLRRKSPNLFVIYFMHTLQNYSWRSPYQVATARALRSAGVDLVIGSGAHMMQEVEDAGNDWTFYGIGNFIFNAGGRYSENHAPPFSLPLVIDFWIDNGRLQTALRVYPIMSENKITHYQPRLLTEEELSMVNALLSGKSHWDEASHAAVNPGKDDIGRYIKFSTHSVPHGQR